MRIYIYIISDLLESDEKNLYEGVRATTYIYIYISDLLESDEKDLYEGVRATHTHTHT